MKSLNRASVSSITVACSLTTIAVAVSSVNRSSNVKPSPVKNATDRSRSFTARFGNSMRDPFPAIVPSFLSDSWFLSRPLRVREVIGRARTG